MINKYLFGKKDGKYEFSTGLTAFDAWSNLSKRRNFDDIIDSLVNMSNYRFVEKSGFRYLFPFEPHKSPVYKIENYVVKK